MQTPFSSVGRILLELREMSFFSERNSLIRALS